MKTWNLKSVVTLVFASLMLFSVTAHSQEVSPLKGLFGYDYAFLMKIAPEVVAVIEANQKTLDLTSKETKSKLPKEPLSPVGASVDLSFSELQAHPVYFAAYKLKLTNSLLNSVSINRMNTGGKEEVGWRIS